MVSSHSDSLSEKEDDYGHPAVFHTIMIGYISMIDNIYDYNDHGHPAVFHVIVVGPNQVPNPVKDCRNLKAVNYKSNYKRRHFLLY